MSEEPASTDTLREVEACVRALDERKAMDLRVLHVGPISSITDYFIIATGTSQPHLRGLRGTAEGALKELKVHLVGVDTGSDAGWIVIDAYDFMVHLFTGEMRENFNLEGLWKDAGEVDVSAWLMPEPAKR